MRYRITSKSIIGTREDQQDSAFFGSTGRAVFAVVCDGMGGLGHGGVASQTAVEKIRELYRTRPAEEVLPEFFLRAVDVLDEAVVLLRDSDAVHSVQGTTLVAIAVEDDVLHWLSVGDSRLYLLRGQEIVQVTRDHNYALSLQQWTADERGSAASQPGVQREDALISFIGMGGIKIFDLNKTPFRLMPDDMVLLATDGLYRSLSNSDILSALQAAAPGEKLEALVAQSTEYSNGSQDNTTCILIECLGMEERETE